jgi:sugar lactone lactonase YvrE
VLAYTGCVRAGFERAGGDSGTITPADGPRPDDHGVVQADALTGTLQVSTVAGTGENGSVDGPVATAQFNSPLHIVVDGAGRILVTESKGFRIRKIEGGMVSTVAGEGIEGDVDGPVKAARFGEPHGIAVDGAGKIYFTDTDNNKVKVIGDGQVTTLAGSVVGYLDGPALQARFDSPEGLIVDPAGTIYVADKHNHRIRKITSGTVSTFAGSGTSGTADGPLLTAEFREPYDLAIDGSGQILYVAEETRVRKIAIASGTVSTVAGSTRGFADGPASQALFDGARGVTLDGAGTLVIADRDNNRIRTVDIAMGMVGTLAGTGVYGFKDGAATAAQFAFPYGVAVDASGRVYVADRENHRIRMIVR